MLICLRTRADGREKEEKKEAGENKERKLRKMGRGGGRKEKYILGGWREKGRRRE